MKITLATNNQGKAKEIQHVFAALDYEIISQSEFNIPEVEETGLTFVENAILKARNACRYTNLPAIGDDSGLEVDALGGRPGIYSARYSVGEEFAGDTQAENNVAKILYELKDIPEKKRTARFQCVIVFMRYAKDPAPIICQGTWEGRILFEEKGHNGFGYDPIFWVPTHNCSAAELPIEVKNQISHRGQALACLLKKIRSQI